MSVTLAISTLPGDAVFSIGALLSALPGQCHHVTVFGKDAAEAVAIAQLGARQIELGLSDSASAKTIIAALTPLMDQYSPDNVLLPLGLQARAGEILFFEVLPALKRHAPGTRFLHYYDLPYATQHRTRYPELAFSRPIRGLAEADADAGLFQWKPRGAASAKPLEAKRSAAAALGTELTRRLFPDSTEMPPPSDNGELAELQRRALGTREWVQLA